MYMYELHGHTKRSPSHEEERKPENVCALAGLIHIHGIKPYLAPYVNSSVDNRDLHAPE